MIDLNELGSLLAGDLSLDLLPEVQRALKGHPKGEVSDDQVVAISFDANVLKRLPQRPGADVTIDFLRTEHAGPLIVPHQAIQEYWNNRTAIESVGQKVRKSFDALDREIRALDASYESLRDGADDLLGEFREEFGHVLDAKVAATVDRLMEILVAGATVGQVKRGSLADVADQRKRTRTPPGFNDNGDGDFFVWAETLAGLRQEIDAGRWPEVGLLALVTEDLKSDWSIGGVAHPSLAAEAAAFCGCRFETWTLVELESFIANDGADAAEDDAGDLDESSAAGAPVDPERTERAARKEVGSESG